jgi:hypothetical protein
MFVSLLLTVSCRHHAGSDLVQAPPAPPDCAAWYEIDAPASACRGVVEPRPATMTTAPRVEPRHANCMLRCDQSRPRWEVDIQTPGFRGTVLCTIDGGPKLRLAIDTHGGSRGAIDTHGGSDGVRAQWLEPNAGPEWAVGAGSTVHRLRMPGALSPCSERTTP